MGAWRNTSKIERTMLYSAIADSVKRIGKKKLTLRQQDEMIAEIFKANKEYYDITLTQMSEFISKQ